MASNTSPSFGVELRNINHFQNSSPQSSSEAANVFTQGTTDGSRVRRLDGVGGDTRKSSIISSPFEALTQRYGRPLRVAILSDFTRIPYANGAVFQTRLLYQQLRRCGHQVTVIGPKDPDSLLSDLAPGTVELPSLPLKTYPGVHLPMPLASWVFDPDRWNFDICFAQTTSLLLEFGVWLRKMKGIPLLCVNTTHLTAAYDVLLPERLSKVEAVHAGLSLMMKRPFERVFSSIYNESDGLVVLSEGLRDYWRERGVTVPIHVIPRAVSTEIFDRAIGADPYATGGPRLLVAGRHTREKSQDRAIRIFARHVLPEIPDATLTLVGEGPDTAYYRRVAEEEGAGDRVVFAGEVPFDRMPDYYAYADVFVHTSLSETYGNVMGEALWCGTPTVAFADGMGVSSQIQDGHNGVLLAPGTVETEAAQNRAFGAAVVSLLRDPHARGRLSKNASRAARDRASPRAVETRIADAFQHAQEHQAASGLRPVVDRPKVLHWLTTLKHARPWAAMNGGVYLFGHLRPSKVSRKKSLHPQIGG